MLRIFSSPIFKTFLALCIVALLVYFNRLDMSVLVDLTYTWPWLLAAFLVMLPSFLIVSCRFKIVLLAQGISAPVSQAIRWTMIGSFFDLGMPSSSGGDLVKAGYIVRHVGVGKRTQAVMSVVFDRMFGLLGLFLLVVIASGLGWSVLSEFPARNMVVTVALVTCIGMLIFLRVAGSRYIYKSVFVERILSRKNWGVPVKKTIKSFNALREQPRYLLLILSLSTINHVFWCCSLFCIVKALGLSVDTLIGLVVFPLAIFSNVFGVAGGFGGGTAGFDIIFSQLLSVSNGALVGLLFQSLSALARLTGLPFYISSPREVPSLSELNVSD